LHAVLTKIQLPCWDMMYLDAVVEMLFRDPDHLTEWNRCVQVCKSMDLQFGIFQILRCPIESNGSVRKLYWSSGLREQDYRNAAEKTVLLIDSQILQETPYVGLTEQLEVRGGMQEHGLAIRNLPDTEMPN
jgi:hypothetical protein